MNTSEKKLVTVLMILTIVFTIMGGTLAYFNWQSSSEQNTAVTFTVASGFSCSADGGGSINNNSGTLAPAHCTNSTYAFKRTIKANVVNNRGANIYLDMWLNVNSIDSGLANSDNFKYALTTDPESCTTDVVSEGTFKGTKANDKVYILEGKSYPVTTNDDTFYLYVWLDAAETSSSTQNQNFSLTLGGECSDVNYAYSIKSWGIGGPLLNSDVRYHTPEDAMNALKTAGGGKGYYPFFLRQRLEEISETSFWCIEVDGICTMDVDASTEDECNTILNNAPLNSGHTYTCNRYTYNNKITEIYVGFVITEVMANANSGMTAGTYYLKGDKIYEWDSSIDDKVCKSENIDSDSGECISSYYETNKATLLKAFGSTNCNEEDGEIMCGVDGLHASSSLGGDIFATDTSGSSCNIYNDGNNIYCETLYHFDSNFGYCSFYDDQLNCSEQGSGSGTIIS